MPDAPLTSLLRAAEAASARTLTDVLTGTARAHPDALAVDDGTRRLTYAELVERADDIAGRLADAGIGRGDRVGVRIPSGHVDLYLAILGTLRAGAAYVPVDADDPDERARLVFGEADVAAVLGAGLDLAVRRPRGPRRLEEPTPGDDAWVIFTSGSTGTPKGVAVSHRSAAAFVDAEARMFLQDDPLGPEDRVLAGLSVAFDASCEEMWLAWGHGACLVPAPRSLVRSGVDLGPWLVTREISVVSTVPTLAALWPQEALDNVRLLIFGGEGLPAELAARLVAPGREVWNTYGPTEATVVACGARMDGTTPIRIGLPLAGWDLAVVDAAGEQVAPGESGELIIGGVGLARYLDPAKDAEKYAPMPSLGWDRAYRSGDLVRCEPEGLVFLGRADEQVKLGGRRIELGEVDAALSALPGVMAGASAVQLTATGTQVLVGYLVAEGQTPLDLDELTSLLRRRLPAGMVPRLVTVESLPTRTSGKVDRAALPWPWPELGAVGEVSAPLTGTAGWLAEQWGAVLGGVAGSEDADFFLLGGGSLSAAQLVSRLRERFPDVTVRDLYAHPRLGAQAAMLEASVETRPVAPSREAVAPLPAWTGWVQTLSWLLAQAVAGLRWAAALMVAVAAAHALGLLGWVPGAPWWVTLVTALLLLTPPGRGVLGVLAARLLLAGVRPGTYPRGGAVHLRHWLAEALQDALGSVTLAAAPWMTSYARGLGARIGTRVALHSVPPVTGWLTLGDGSSVEPEVDLSGAWVDGDRFHLGTVTVLDGASVGARSTLGPGALVGPEARVEAGSSVLGPVPGGERWGGSPAVRVGKKRDEWPDHEPPRAPAWRLWYALTAGALAIVPWLAATPGLAVLLTLARGDRTPGDLALSLLVAVPAGAVLGGSLLALLTLVLVRLLGANLVEGTYPVRSWTGWRLWATERLLDSARELLFPLYASLFTPTWFRWLGARVGRDTEISTAVMIPGMATVAEGAFLADDTLVGAYEMWGGWVRIARAKVGRRAFLGNSGITAPGRRVPKNGLVAVLSQAPRKAKAGTSWLGSPPVRLRRTARGGDESLTYAPPTRLKVQRALVEACRVVPFAVAVGVPALAAWLVLALAATRGWGVAAPAAGLAVSAAGIVGALLTVAAKWLLVGRFRAQEQPLWSSFVWRGELADTFTEMVAVPWLVRRALGTPVATAWLRLMGARIGRGAWVESYWLPEADLVTIGRGATVNRGCVVQTHLFHDRVMQLDEVTLAEGATLGPNSVVLPAGGIGAHATVGPASLVLRGETIPAGTRWRGNPTEPWHEGEEG